LTKPAKAPLSLDWEELYKTRMELDRRWEKGEPKVMKITGHEDR
jgi:F-box and WD-40 domain protein 1/11